MPFTKWDDDLGMTALGVAGERAHATTSGCRFTAAVRRSSFGKMPTTSARRLTYLLSRSSGWWCAIWCGA